jgi:hypothetical protein
MYDIYLELESCLRDEAALTSASLHTSTPRPNSTMITSNVEVQHVPERSLGYVVRLKLVACLRAELDLMSTSCTLLVPHFDLRYHAASG